MSYRGYTPSDDAYDNGVVCIFAELELGALRLILGIRRFVANCGVLVAGRSDRYSENMSYTFKVWSGLVFDSFSRAQG
jgi:hypothetical protein